MMRAIGALLLLIGLSQPVFAQNAKANQAYGAALQARAIATAATPRLVPVATGTHYPFQASTGSYTVGLNLIFRTAHYFPRGSTSTRIILTSTFANAIEQDTTTGFQVREAVSIDPAPWDPTKSYNIGDAVVWYGTTSGGGSYNYNPFFVAVAANTNSAPTPGNTNWAAGTRPTPIPVTFSGQRDGSIGTQLLNAASYTASISATTLTVTNKLTGTVAVGQTVVCPTCLANTLITALGTGAGGNGTYSVSQSQTVASVGMFSTSPIATGLLTSDPIALTIPAGSWLGVYSWLPMSGAQVAVIDGQGQSDALGAMKGSAATEADPTVSTALTGYTLSGAAMRPTAIIGVPVVPGEGVALFGDSIAEGKIGTKSLGTGTIVSGGSGYKVGDLLTISNTGATAGAVAAGSTATFIVDAVSSGAITALRVVDTGGYTDTLVAQTGQTLPSGTQTLIGGSGTGATANVTFASNPYDVGDRLGGQGAFERAFDLAAIPYVAFASSGDRVDLWRVRSYSRIAAAAATGATRAIIELCRNDFSNGDSAALCLANNQWLARTARGLGFKKVFVTTITPKTTSTTAAGESTLTDQTVTADDTQRQAYNLTLRTNCATTAGCQAMGFDALIDTAAAIENGGASAPTGKFDPIGGLPCSADGTHPGPSCLQKMVPVIQAALPALISLNVPANDNAPERLAA